MLFIQVVRSKPFGLQVPVKDKCLSYCPVQNFNKELRPRIMRFIDPKHQMDADFA